MTDKIAELADAVGAFAVGPEDRIVISLPDADLSTIQHVHHAFVEKGFDMERVLILGGAGVQLGVVRAVLCRCGEVAGPEHCDHCHNDPPRGHRCPRCGAEPQS